MNQDILGKVSDKIASINFERLESWKPADDIKEALKELKHELSCKSNSRKKELQRHLEKKGKIDVISQNLLPLSLDDKDNCLTPLR